MTSCDRIFYSFVKPKNKQNTTNQPTGSVKILLINYVYRIYIFIVVIDGYPQ